MAISYHRNFAISEPTVVLHWVNKKCPEWLSSTARLKWLVPNLHSHSLFSGTVCVPKTVFGRRKQTPITAHAQGFALHLSQQLIQDTQTVVLSVVSTVLASTAFWEALLPFPSSPKTSNWQTPAKYFGLTKPAISPSNPTHLRTAQQRGGKPRCSPRPRQLDCQSSIQSIKSNPKTLPRH